NFTEERLSPGRIYFLNTQKLAVTADLTKRGPSVNRSFNFYDVVRSTVEDEPRRIVYLVNDEAHRGMSEDDPDSNEANSIIQRFIKGYTAGSDRMPPCPVFLGISATPAKFLAVVEGSERTVTPIQVPLEDVRASGLIKDNTFAFYAGEDQMDPVAVFPEAVATWKTVTEAWEQYHAGHPGEPLVSPALIVQVENETADGQNVTQTPLAEVIQAVIDGVGPLPDSAFVHAFGESQSHQVGAREVRYVDPTDIADDEDARVVFYKTSLGTGWDCPRAEVLFSFRRQVEPTNIAQTIGRMIRTPLHRRIEEDERLNAAHVYLPHYDKNSVDAIVAELNEKGADAVASTLAPASERVSLNLREDSTTLQRAIEQVPTYSVGTPRKRSETRTLVALSNFLANQDVDNGCFGREIGDLVQVLSALRRQLEGDESFTSQIQERGEIVLRKSELLGGLDMGGEEEELVVLPASEHLIGRLFSAAKTTLTGDLAEAYVRARYAMDGESIRVAQLEAYALASRATTREALDQHSSARVDALRRTHGGAVAALPPGAHSAYRDILRQAPAPVQETMRLVVSGYWPKGDNAPPGHLYVDADGQSPIRLNRWERSAVEQDIQREGVLGWLRCYERQPWALCVPWRDDTVDRPFYPDFLIVREVDGRVLVDVTDPHDPTRPDALGKAQGLSAYAHRHAEILGHVDLVAELDGRFRRLHLETAAVRQQVDRLTTVAELANLYRQYD
ncbi:MAG: hypothetical protein ACKN9D_03480, partial [Actinomycetales bacterium]